MNKQYDFVFMYIWWMGVRTGKLFYYKLYSYGPLEITFNNSQEVHKKQTPHSAFDTS